MIHYQYVSVPIPTTPQAIRPLVEKPNTASTATPFILPIEANESHRGQSTVHWQGAAHIVSRSIEHWQRLHQLDPLGHHLISSTNHYKIHEQETPKSLPLQRSTANLGPLRHVYPDVVYSEADPALAP